MHVHARCHCELCTAARAFSDRPLTRITILAHDPDGTLVKLLQAIKLAGNVGHSFSIVVDPDDEREQKFFWDGDGADSIRDVRVERLT